MKMKEQTALWLGIQDLKYEISSLREALEEISRGFDSDSRNYTREQMMKMAKESLKGESK